MFHMYRILHRTLDVVLGSCEYDTESLGCVEGKESVIQLSSYKLFKNVFAPWNQLRIASVFCKKLISITG